MIIRLIIEILLLGIVTNAMGLYVYYYPSRKAELKDVNIILCFMQKVLALLLIAELVGFGMDKLYK